MKIYLFLCVMALVCVGCSSVEPKAPVKIIFDTDIGGDADDLGALVMLHNFVDKGECKLLAVMSWAHDEYAVAAIDAINRYYHHPDIPIGGRKDNIFNEERLYNKPIADHFEHKLTYKDVPDTTTLYRKILSQQADGSVVLVTVGPLLNIQRLIQSQPDSVSDLTGGELISRKVRNVVMMGGHFPGGKGEWNFSGQMPGVTKFVLEHLEAPVVFSGFEIGRAIRTGEVFNDIDKNTPLYVGYLHFCQHASWMPPYEGRLVDNSTFDQTAVLYAVRGGVGRYWDKIEGGYCQVDDNGDNRWVEGAVTNHAYLKLIEEPEVMAQLIESIMLNKF
ncbi:MAG: nucleoside hydrolase [Sedimentisphaerales bacterium]|nr:nucleoside hydrolase [Sedimentisphaerales bacterium]